MQLICRMRCDMAETGAQAAIRFAVPGATTHPVSTASDFLTVG